MKRDPTSTERTQSAPRRVAFPPERRLVLDTLHLGRDKPMMHGLLELDVTDARARLRAHRERTGASVSFTAFLLACIGRAVAEHREVHALTDWLGRIVIFDEVDATTIVEVDVDGRKFPLAHVVRGIDRRTVQSLSDELRQVQRSGMRSLPPALRAGARLLLGVPGFVRRQAYRAFLASPVRAKARAGTLLVTAVGMFGAGAGWGLSAPGVHNLSILIGGIGSRPALDAAGALTSRELLCLTVSANHELVDGAPLARFASELARRIEAADGLEALAGS